MSNSLKKWEEDPLETGGIFEFNSPQRAESIRVVRGKEIDETALLTEETLQHRVFMRGKLIKIINNTAVFIGHKIPAPGCKKPKANYLFKLRKT